MALNITAPFEYYNSTFPNLTLTDGMNINSFAGASKTILKGGETDIYRMNANGALSFADSYMSSTDSPPSYITGTGYGCMANSKLEAGESKSGDIYCEAESSCLNADIVSSDEIKAQDYDCPGLTSCAYTDHNVSGYFGTSVGGGGVLSHYKGRMETSGDSYIAYDISLAGVLSGYQMNFVCNTTDECEIYCENPLGCLNTTLYCMEDSQCDVIYPCNDTQGIFCPSVISVDVNGTRMYWFFLFFIFLWIDSKKKKKKENNNNMLTGPSLLKN